MAEYILKDSSGKEQTFADDKIFVQGTDGELVQFTMGTGGSASADLHYVTFMSYDGLTEYGKKAVADGDDCADPIARGIFDTPTRESDAQYNYTFGGWATEANGEVDSDWNKAVTEDRTVYASFTGALRYYTITFYDEDGTTVLNTESVAYGSVPSYVPTKDGYILIGWIPEAVAVTGDASYIAQWTDDFSFANADWSVIQSVLKAGQVNAWSVGDKRTIPVKTYDGTSMNVVFEIRDILSDSIIIISQTVFNTGLWSESGSYISFNTTGENGWFSTDANRLNYAYQNVVFNGLPDDMKELVAKRRHTTYTKISDSDTFKNYYTTDKVWIPDATEIGSWYPDNNARKKQEQTKTEVGSSYVNYLNRNMRKGSQYVRQSYVNTNGEVVDNINSTTTYKVAPIAMELKAA